MSELVVQPEQNITLTAELPEEMVMCQKQLIEWMQRKVEIEKADTAELEAAYLHAKKCKWKHTALQNAFNKGVKRVNYYTKLLGALEHGYYIVPNMPVDMFAIRTKKTSPEPNWYYGKWDNATRRQEAQELPETVGEYKNPFPLISSSPCPEEGKPDQRAFYANGWDEFEFPVNMAKPQIMKAVERAMALKIFDQIGILPGRGKKDDPIIIGQIKLSTGPYRQRIVSFMIVWHLDTRVL